MTATPAAGARQASEGVEAVLRQRLASLSLEQKVRLLAGADFWSLWPEPATGLRRLVVSDGPAGVRGERWDERDPSANVPSPTALAASWDEDGVERIGRLLAAEARRKGVDVLLAPTVNLHRSPYGGRHFECFSEDPLLTARIGAAYVRGVQAGGVAATVKHFVANDSETDRLTLDALVDERTLRERYLAPFEPIVREAGVWAVMAAYNSINGTTATEHPMLREILKDELAALRHNPAVALTIDTEVHPPTILLIRGRAELDVVEGIPDEYLAMNGTYTMTPEQRVEWEADVRSLYDGMVRIVVTPTWVKLIDFETTLPSAVAELVRRREERQRA